MVYIVCSQNGPCHGWMDELGFYVPFNSISVISGRRKGEDEKLCAMKRCLGLERILLLAGFEPATLWSEVRSANRSATWTLRAMHEIMVLFILRKLIL